MGHRIWMNLRNIFILMTLALGSESENTLGTTGKGLRNSLKSIDSKIFSLKSKRNFFKAMIRSLTGQYRDPTNTPYRQLRYSAQPSSGEYTTRLSYCLYKRHSLYRRLNGL